MTQEHLTLKSPLRATVPVDNSAHEGRGYDLYGELETEGASVTALNNGHISKPGDPLVHGTFGRNPDGTLWLNLDCPSGGHAGAMAAVAAFVEAACAKGASAAAAVTG